MNDSAELLTSVALAIFVMGLFVTFVVICGIANAREEYRAQKKTADAKRRRSIYTGPARPQPALSADLSRN